MGMDKTQQLVFDYNNLKDNFNALQKRYKNLEVYNNELYTRFCEKKEEYNTLVDEFKSFKKNNVSMEDHLQVVKEHQERYKWLLDDYNRLAEDYNNLYKLVEIGLEGVKRAYLVDGNSNAVFAKEAKKLLFLFAEKADELLRNKE